MPTVGSIVYLKSGGPGMTVVDIQRDMVVCNWFDEKGELCESSFLASTLTQDDCE